ncbi:neutral/alkaline non-lysosomal ceramidase N-terminal domain-containing protein [Pontibacter sp. BT731]|uniref:neutral/alkaline non-lysosomal ceramidase N-terminal domain-containing protein n=1 Tax=Pontibacter coccineus TaxID=3063328 RepID=UPI0026E2985B|nr:neutral/alkaline non-lysosomal ceramidase N-terminal domain-containing protein [Pontibacter sp. BT731]MDO6388937.1 neutral/alkaline non-lysosomal ceramidase N-terminal domain-containing protein [Pontibacter sp. BT731]
MGFRKQNKISLWVLLSLLLCAMQSCVVQRIDYTPFAQTDYYRHTLQELEGQPPVTNKADSLQVGWSKVNITPPVGTPLAGYGKRKGLRYSTVHDSVWVRTFAFDNGQTEVIFVVLDMLIAPMTVAAALEKEYAAMGLSPGQVYLSATHTHSSFGGWGRKLVGRLMAGRYSKQLVQQTTAHIVQSIQLARQNKRPSRLGYGIAYAPQLVRNRLTGAVSGRDTTVRFFKIEQVSGKTAVLATFAAHPTILPSMDPVLSRDYPGELVDQLETSVDFAAFAAGAVGSQAVVAPHGDTYASTAAVGQELAAAILEKLPGVELQHTARLCHARHPLMLPKPQWRLNTNLRFAPFLFHWLFGKYPTYINSMQLGEAVLLGVPADYSGEFLPLLEQQGLPIVVTGFNGGYIGYITPDRHYPLKKYETRSMNFYGPQSGSYMTEILRKIMDSYQLKDGRNN